MSTFPATEALRYGTEKAPVYIHRPCLEVVAWSGSCEKEYGPIELQGCDRCDCSPDGEWTEVRVKL